MTMLNNCPIYRRVHTAVSKVFEDVILSLYHQSNLVPISPLGPPVQVTCGIFVVSFGSISELNMVSEVILSIRGKLYVIPNGC